MYRSCYDVTRAALGVGISGATLLLIGFLVLGLACHCQHQKRQDKKHKLKNEMLQEREKYARQARKEKRERDECREERERERQLEKEERDRDDAREKELLELANLREEREELRAAKAASAVGPPFAAYNPGSGFGPMGQPPMVMPVVAPGPPHHHPSPRRYPYPIHPASGGHAPHAPPAASHHSYPGGNNGNCYPPTHHVISPRMVVVPPAAASSSGGGPAIIASVPPQGSKGGYNM